MKSTKEMTPLPIIGIDLGTTNSLVSCIINGEPTVIPNIHGHNLTPSVVSIGEQGEVFVGHIAKERQVTHPLRTVAVFKRSMGTKKRYNLGGTSFTPEDLSSFIIKKLKEDAEVYLGQEITEAVVSVPAYFNDAQRRATKVAGELAGLKVERIVNEPTAASLAYGFHEAREYAKFLIFDLGGGTFDISILEKYEAIMEVRAVAGDVFLGGEDFTDVLSELFARRAELKVDTLSLEEKLILRREIEAAKVRYGETKDVAIHFKAKDAQYQATITLRDYEKACEELLTRLRIPIKRAISDASIKVGDIDAIILVGGATKLPIIRNFVTDLFQRFPHFTLSPDEVVAMGVAVHAGLKERNESISEIVLTDVCPFTLGVDTVMTKTKGIHKRDVFLPIIERNTTIPASRMQNVQTLHDQQDQIMVLILQGESHRSSENAELGHLHVPVPRGPAGQESVDIRFTYDINGILECEVTVRSTQFKKSLIIEKNPGIFTPEEVAEKLKALAAYRLHPREKEEYKLLLARGERLYQESLGDYRTYIGDQVLQFEQLLDAQDEEKIQAFLPEFKEFLDSLE